MNESLLSGTKRSRGASHDAAGNMAVSALARETGITEQTLYVWRREAKGKGLAVPGDGKNAEGWSSENKFAVVLETAPLNAAELAEYCRRKGLYAEQIAAWRASCVAANSAEQARGQRQQSKEDKQRIKQLEKEPKVRCWSLSARRLLT